MNKPNFENEKENSKACPLLIVIIDKVVEEEMN